MNLNDAKALAELIAPELKGRLAVVRHPEGWATGNAAAYASPVAGYRLAGEHGVDPTQPIITFVNEPTAGVLCHEVAHIVPVDGAGATVAAAAFESGELDEPSAYQTTETDFLAAGWAYEESLGLPPWVGHDYKFIRRALHLRHRAELAGVSIDLFDLNVAGGFYGLSPVQAFIQAIGSEPDDFANYTFTAIEALGPPGEFVRVFFDDTLAFHKRARKCS